MGPHGGPYRGDGPPGYPGPNNNPEPESPDDDANPALSTESPFSATLPWIIHLIIIVILIIIICNQQMEINTLEQKNSVIEVETQAEENNVTTSTQTEEISSTSSTQTEENSSTTSTQTEEVDCTLTSLKTPRSPLPVVLYRSPAISSRLFIGGRSPNSLYFCRKWLRSPKRKLRFLEVDHDQVNKRFK